MSIGNPFRRSKPPVHVLGAGPAGLLAAHAATTKGYQVKVFSKPDFSGQVAKSELFGCQYLHSAIPGVTGAKGEVVQYKLEGPVDGYRRKVYGDNWNGPVSPDEYGPEEEHYAWDLRTAYDLLFDVYCNLMRPIELSPASMNNLRQDAYVLNTIPAPALCRDVENHKFVSQQVYAMGTTTPSVYDCIPVQVPSMTVVCNGHRDTGWYRAASVFGYSTAEWPGGKRPPLHGIAAVSKPLSTDCTCWLNERTLRVGRFGKWEKGVLVHTAYFDTLKWLP